MWYSGRVSESALAGLAVIKIRASLPSGAPAEITVHARQATNIAHTLVGLQGLADDVATLVSGAGWRALHGNSVQLTDVVVQDLSPTIFAPVTAPTNVVGTRGAGQPTASQNSLVVTKTTGLQGRAMRGRFYTYGALAADLNVDGGSWDQTFADDWEAAIVDLYDAIALASPVEYRAVIWHKEAFGDPPAGADTVTNITGAQGRIGLAVQKGRRE